MNNVKEIITENMPSPDSLLPTLVGILTKDPVTYTEILINACKGTRNILDTIFINNFRTFLLYGFTEDTILDYDKLRKFSQKLEENGNATESAIRIIKCIESIETENKAKIISNLTQSLINSAIDHDNYFKLLKTVVQLTEEDISFLRNNITGKIMCSPERLDDFLILGLYRMVNGGYVFTERSWDLLEHGILYGHHVSRPQIIPKQNVQFLASIDVTKFASCEDAVNADYQNSLLKNTNFDMGEE